MGQPKSDASARRWRRAVALAAAAAGAACSAEDAAPGPPLPLRDSGASILCGVMPTGITAIPGPRLERYGISQPLDTPCEFSLEIPEETTLSLRIKLAGREIPRTASVRVSLAATVSGDSRTLLDEPLAKGQVIERQVGVPQGSTAFSMRAEAKGVPHPRATRVAWTDLSFETRARNPPPPWPLPIDEALEPFFATQAPRGDPRRRLLVVGIDGASWKHLAPLLERGALPNLAAVRARGRHGVLASTTVPESAMSWTTMRTGVGPGRHGTFSFHSPRTTRRSTWHLLGDRGLRSIVVAVPEASTDRPIEGVHIGGWTTQLKSTQPAELREPLLRAGYRGGLRHLRNPRLFQEHMRLRTEIAIRMFERLDWDHAFLVYEYSDTAAHLLGLGTKAWAHVQRGVDALLGRLLRHAGEDTTVLIVSDHGWRSYSRRLSVGTWLRHEGFRGLAATIPMSGNVVSISQRQGAAPPDDETLARVREGLLALRDPRDGRRPVVRVSRPEEIFSGPYAASSGVSLIVELDLAYRAPRGGAAARVFAPGPHTHHDPEGIYILAGPGIAPGEGPRASVKDVAPTVLSFYGVPVPPDLTGTPLWDFGVPVQQGASALYFEEPVPGAPSIEVPVDPELDESLRALGYIE